MKFLIFSTIIIVLAATFSACRVKKSSAVAIKGNAILIDVRSVAEFNEGYLPGAINIPHTEVADKISTIAPDKSTPLYLYCRSGRRVDIAMKALKEIGYTDMTNLGGLNDAANTLKLKPVKP